MKIVTLVENTTIDDRLKSMHGLSLYIQTKNHKLLVDMGGGDAFLKNAQVLGIDISEVDTAIITHGHSDHGGGLEAFLGVNKKAKVYVQRKAFSDYYSKIIGFARVNISLKKELMNHPQIVLLDGNFRLDDEIFLFVNPEKSYPLPKFNSTLYQKIDKRLIKDKFEHEQSLLIFEEKTLLVGGCAHRGILNIIRKAYKYSDRIDFVISGFHLTNPALKLNENNNVVEELAKMLAAQDIMYYTCHCTGEKPFSILKEHLNDKIAYLATGSRLQ